MADLNISASPIAATLSLFADVQVVADPIVLTLTPAADLILGVSVKASSINTNVSLFADVRVASAPIVLNLTPAGSIFLGPAFHRDPSLDQIIDGHRVDSLGNKDLGIPVLTVGIDGTWLNKTVIAEPLEILVTPIGVNSPGLLFANNLIDITLGITSEDMIHKAASANWVAWSDIGNLNFDINQSNIAGRRPMEWNGWAYAVKQLGNRVVVYGDNGIAVLIPSGNTYGYQLLQTVGLKGKHAIAGNNEIHFFVNQKSELWEFSQQLSKLDYSEYLSTLVDPVLSWDEENRLLYACDGTNGLIYNPASQTLGTGPANITGILSQDGELYITAAGSITTPNFEICTDVYDFGTRAGKTIYSLEFGLDDTTLAMAAIDYRLDGDFQQTLWQPVDSRGQSYIPCYGKDFRFKLGLSQYHPVKLDYIRVNGAIN